MKRLRLRAVSVLILLLSLLVAFASQPVQADTQGGTVWAWGGLLRAERAGNGDGRVYTLTYEIRDGAGNLATEVVAVSVPHDLGT